MCSLCLLLYEAVYVIVFCLLLLGKDGRSVERGGGGHFAAASMISRVPNIREKVEHRQFLIFVR